MRATSKLLALALTAALQPAIAAVAPISLNFEDIGNATNEDGVLNLLTPRYAGVEFLSASWGVANIGCDGIFSFVQRNAGDCKAFLLASDLTEPLPDRPAVLTAKINVAGGFISGSSLYYSALLDAGLSITAYSGLNGTGQAFGFDVGDVGGCGSSAAFCNWTKLDLDLGSFTARSLFITGVDSTVMLDDLLLVAPADVTPPGRLPEPGGIALALGALGALGWSRKRGAR